MLKKSLLFTLALSSFAICDDIGRLKPIPTIKPMAFQHANIRCPANKYCDPINAVGVSSDNYVNSNSLVKYTILKRTSSYIDFYVNNDKSRIYRFFDYAVYGIAKKDGDYYPVIGTIYMSKGNNISLECKTDLVNKGYIDYKKCEMQKAFFISDNPALLLDGDLDD